MADVLKMFEEHKNAVYRTALSYVCSISDAEDICQTAFIKLLEHSEVPDEKAKSWLLKVTVNLCKDYRKSFWNRNREPLDENISFEIPEQGEAFFAMMNLDKKERTAVYLFYYEGYKTEEIAKILGISQSAVTTRLSRARKKMKMELEAERNE